MGFLRFYLAICVVHAHTGNLFPWPSVQGRYAVEMFFVISGFYMAMILSQKYTNIKDFYGSRWERIAIPYYFHFVFILLLSLISGILFSKWLALEAFAGNPLSHNGLIGIILTSISNLTIFGQDAVLFFKDNIETGFQFTTNFTVSPEPLYRYLIIPQCWSVSLELLFYILVPLLCGLPSRWLGLILLSSFLARIFAFQFIGLNNDPWFYRFFPFESTLFIAGMLIWRLLKRVMPHLPKSGKCPAILYIAGCCCMMLLGFYFPTASWKLGWHIGEAYSGIALILLFAPCIAPIFYMTRNMKFDRVIGELSYPIYLNHLIIIITLRSFPQLKSYEYMFGWITAILSISFAFTFWYFCSRKMDAKRHQKFHAVKLSV
ncbi:MAG: acyltransferase family protein [Chthoniobacterales bacterium]